MRRALEQELQVQTRKYEYKSDFARTYFAQGRAEGEAAGEAKGRVEGEAKGRAEALLAVLTARGMALDTSTRERIVSCTDSEQLQRWIMRAATASSLQEVLEEP
jgi:flagellar biosynthesis/type III secretory pathway protein FliH